MSARTGMENDQGSPRSPEEIESALGPGATEAAGFDPAAVAAAHLAARRRFVESARTALGLMRAEDEAASKRAELLDGWFSGRTPPAMTPDVAAVYRGASGLETFLAWAEAHGWDDAEWDILLAQLVRNLGSAFDRPSVSGSPSVITRPGSRFRYRLKRTEEGA